MLQEVVLLTFRTIEERKNVVSFRPSVVPHGVRFGVQGVSPDVLGAQPRNMYDSISHIVYLDMITSLAKKWSPIPMAPRRYPCLLDAVPLTDTNILSKNKRTLWTAQHSNNNLFRFFADTSITDGTKHVISKTTWSTNLRHDNHLPCIQVYFLYSTSIMNCGWTDTRTLIIPSKHRLSWSHLQHDRQYWLLLFPFLVTSIMLANTNVRHTSINPPINPPMSKHLFFSAAAHSFWFLPSHLDDAGRHKHAEPRASPVLYAHGEFRQGLVLVRSAHPTMEQGYPARGHRRR